MEDPTHGDSVPGGHAHAEIHMPPNSWVPISTAFAITAVLVGLLVGFWLVIIGGVWLIASLVAWVRAARAEFEELPG
jgi:hypothetical protein